MLKGETRLIHKYLISCDQNGLCGHYCKNLTLQKSHHRKNLNLIKLRFFQCEIFEVMRFLRWWDFCGVEIFAMWDFFRVDSSKVKFSWKNLKKSRFKFPSQVRGRNLNLKKEKTLIYFSFAQNGLRSINQTVRSREHIQSIWRCSN